MAVVYQPTRKMVGEHARSLEYELLKIQEKLDDLEARVTALGG